MKDTLKCHTALSHHISATNSLQQSECINSLTQMFWEDGNIETQKGRHGSGQRVNKAEGFSVYCETARQICLHLKVVSSGDCVWEGRPELLLDKGYGGCLPPGRSC